MKFGRSNQSPIDDQVAEADIADRLRMANALRDKSNAGAQLENVGGHLIGSPVARVLTGVVQGFEGGQERKKAYGTAEDLATSKRDRLVKALTGSQGLDTPDKVIDFFTPLLANPDTVELARYQIETAQKGKERGAARLDEQSRRDYQDKVGEDRAVRQEAAAERRHRERLEADKLAADARLGAIAARGGSGDDLTAHLKDIAYLRTLDIKPDDPPDVVARKKSQQDEYYQVIRAQQVIDRGGTQDVLQPGAPPGTVAASLEKTVPPAQTAQHLADVEREKKRVTLAPKAQAALSQFEAKSQQFDAAIDRAIEKTSGGSSGAMGWSSGIPMTPAKELAAELQEIASNIGFDALAEMRANSPTGAALGNVANYEIQNLQSTLGTLDQAREPEKIIETLTRIKQLRQASLQRMREAYDETWGAASMPPPGGAPMAPPPAEAPPPAGVDPEDWVHLSVEERADFIRQSQSQ